MRYARITTQEVIDVRTANLCTGIGVLTIQGTSCAQVGANRLILTLNLNKA